jgi:predicted dehydrogenase
MPESGNVSRRSFIRSAAAGGAAMALNANAQRAVAGANERIRIGIIGTGGIANSHRGAILKIAKEENCEISAVCDVFESRMNTYAGKVMEESGNSPRTYLSYHDLLNDKSVDKVTICTPEHWHAKQTIDACRAGKEVYVEKPMTHSAEEGVEVLKVIGETKRIVQVGVQGMSDDTYQAANDYIQTGEMGHIVHAQIDYVRRYTMHQGPWRTEAKTGDPKPEDLNWEAWIGPAKKRPWDARRYFDWRNYWDYSGGICTDLFVHRITRLIKAMGVTEPIRGVGMGGIYLWPDGREVPDNFEMVLEYPEKLTVHVLGTMGNQHGLEHLIRGYDATLIFEQPGFKVYPQAAKLRREKGDVIKTHQRTGGEDQSLHHQNHHAAMRSGTPGLLNCPPELGFSAVVAVCMANESWKRREYITWDPVKKQMV